MKARCTAVALTALVSATGCWEQVSPEWFAQMKDQKAVQALEGVRPLDPPEGTVPVGGIEKRLSGPMMPIDDPQAVALVNPIAATPASIERGQEVYGIYCALCHADDGMAIGSPNKPESLNRLMKNAMIPFPLTTIQGRNDGQVFTKIRYGKPTMPGYPQIPAEDRWHIVNYLRSKFGGPKS